MAVVYLNRYVGKWENCETLTVDSVDFTTAINDMIIAKGTEPLRVELVATGIMAVIEKSDVHFIVNINRVGSEVAPGSVYPESNVTQLYENIIFTAVPKTGYRFVNYTDVNGNILGTEAISTIKITENNMIIYANFEVA